MSDMVKIIILAVVQGIAEFLPVSSSGHLAVLGRILDWNPESSAQMNIVLHAGTLAAIVAFYFRQLCGLRKPAMAKRVIPAIIIGSIPAAIIGISIKSAGVEECLFGDITIAGIGFIVTALMLLKVSNAPDGGSELKDIKWKQALQTGLAQGLAILPGISRSGATITTGIESGIRKADSATFSFMLAIPAIGGAGLLELISAVRAHELDFASAKFHVLAAGFAISATVGYFSLALLLRILSRGKLNIFAYYLFGAGVLTLGWKLYQILN